MAAPSWGQLSLSARILSLNTVGALRSMRPLSRYGSDGDEEHVNATHLQVSDTDGACGQG